MSASAFASAAQGWQAAVELGLGGLERLRPEWEALCAERGGAALLLQPAWVRAHVEALEEPSGLELHTMRRDGQLRAVLPLLRERVWFCGVPAVRLRAAAGVYSVRFDLLAARGEEGQAAADALAVSISDRRGWDVLELRDVPAGGVAEHLIAALAARGHATGRWLALQSPYVEMAAGEGLPAGFGSTSKKFRNQLAQGRRGIQAEFGPIHLERLDWRNGEELAAHLDRFYAFEHAGWKGRNGSSILARAGARDFYDRAAAAMAARGKLALHRLRAGDHLLAMGYGLQDSEAFYVLKWSYDEAFAKHGPGHLLIESMLLELGGVQPPLARFDITGGDEPYKQKWTKARLDHSYLFAFRRGPRGALLRSLKFTWTPRVKKMLRKPA